MRYRPTLKRTPTEGNLRRALVQLEGIKERIARGTFVFTEEFPDYRFVRKLAGAPVKRTCNDVFNEFLTHVDARVAKNDLAEREGFEPSKGLITLTPLAGERFRPLSHLS